MPGFFVYDHAMNQIQRIAAIAVGFAMIAIASSTEAADERPTGGRVPTLTRLVKLFTERERALSDAIRSGDAQRTQNFLADDFEMRTGATASNPIPRMEWLSEVTRLRDPGEDASQMAVHDLNGVAIVSFTQGGGANAAFVVDVWRTAGADWRLAIRYAAPAGTAAFPIPGAGAVAPQIPKKF